jgi:Tfp pilus assembly protein FimT
MAIMGLILGAGVAAVIGMGKESRLRGSVTAIRSTVALARQRAVMSGQDVGIIFGEIYPGAISNAYFYAVSNVTEHYRIGETHYLPEGVELEPESTIVFEPRGRTQSGWTQPLFIRETVGSAPEEWRLTIYGLTGLVRVDAP